MWEIIEGLILVLAAKGLDEMWDRWKASKLRVTPAEPEEKSLTTEASHQQIQVNGLNS